MRLKANPIMVSIFLSICLSFMVAAPGLAQNYKSLEGIDSVNTVFDFRTGNPMSALVHIKLILNTYRDKALRKITDKPDFAVVFMDSSVKLLSKNREGFSPEEKKMLDQMDKVISTLSKDGIRLEICLFAAKFYGVDPESITQDINRVDNGWIASIGYQANGYTLVPVY